MLYFSRGLLCCTSQLEQHQLSRLRLEGNSRKMARPKISRFHNEGPKRTWWDETDRLRDARKDSRSWAEAWRSCQVLRSLQFYRLCPILAAVMSSQSSLKHSTKPPRRRTHGVALSCDRPAFTNFFFSLCFFRFKVCSILFLSSSSNTINTPYQRRLSIFSFIPCFLGDSFYIHILWQKHI